MTKGKKDEVNRTSNLFGSVEMSVTWGQFEVDSPLNIIFRELVVTEEVSASIVYDRQQTLCLTGCESQTRH